MQFAKKSLLSYRLKSKKYKFNYKLVLISLLIKKGKKLKARNIVYNFIIKLKKYFIKNIKLNRDYINTYFHSYLEFIIYNFFEKFRPRVLLISKKIAAKKYYIPWFINTNKSRILLLRWFIINSLNRIEKNLSEKLFKEFIDLIHYKGNTMKKIQEYYNIAITNRPFLKLLRKKRKISRSRLKKYSV